MHNRFRGAFDKVSAEEELKNHTREYLRRETHGYGRKSISFPLRPALVFSLALFLGGMGIFLYHTPSFVISVDVNPSMELFVNRFDKVFSVEAYNEEGEAIMSSAKVNHLNYEQALEEILKDENMEQYTAQGQVVSVTVFGKDEEKNSERLVHVSACMASHSNVHCSAGNSKEVSKAHAAGFSCGKYKAFLELQALDPDITEEEVKNLTMCQIQDRINALSGDTEEGGHTGCTGEKQHGACQHKNGHCAE